VIVPVFQKVRSEVQRFGREVREIRDVYQRCLLKMIFRLEKEDYVTCLLYYEVRAQLRSESNVVNLSVRHVNDHKRDTIRQVTGKLWGVRWNMKMGTRQG